jgi:hypothetical protein
MMKKLIAALLFLGCLIGGAVSTSVVLIIVSLCVFGLGNFEACSRLIAAANPIALVLGLLAGAMVFLRQ